MQIPSTLVLLTQKYPFESGEEFLLPELKRIAYEFDRVILIPTAVRDFSISRQVPSNVEVKPIPNPSRSSEVIMSLLKYLPQFLSLLQVELRNSNWNWKLGKYWVYHIPFALTIREELKILLKSHKSILFYSYWMDTNAYALALQRDDFPDLKFIVRTHGGDLYDERSPSGQVAFRMSVYDKAEAIWPISVDGLEYIRRKFPLYQEKLKLAKLGVEDFGIGPLEMDSDVFRIVSCSSLIPLKRVNLIAQVMLHSHLPIQWVHIGGEKEQMEEIFQRIGNGRPSLEVIWRGKVSSEELMKYYSGQFVDALINLSSSEGIPVSMMEAISFGIPIFANNVGGISEIVTEATGCLVEEGLELDSLVRVFEVWLNSGKSRDMKFRNGVREFWKANFDADKNHFSFAEKLNSGLVVNNAGKF